MRNLTVDSVCLLSGIFPCEAGQEHKLKAKTLKKLSKLELNFQDKFTRTFYLPNTYLLRTSFDKCRTNPEGGVLKFMSKIP